MEHCGKNKIRPFFLKVLIIVSTLMGCVTMLAGNPDVAFSQSVQALPEKGPSLDPKGETLQFGVLLPDRRSYTIEGINITQDSARPARFTIAAVGLRHEDTNFVLDPKEWCHLSPPDGSVSKNQPFEFNFRIRLPKKIPAGIPDGLYVGNLHVECPDETSPVKIPFEFTLDLPDFIPVPVNLAEEGLNVEMSCCLPGERDVSFGLTTDAMHDQSVKIVAPLILADDKTGASIPPDHAWISFVSSGSQEAEQMIKHGKDPTNIALRTHVANEKMQPGNYSGQVAIFAELGRTLYIPVYLTIPSSFLVEKLGTYFLIGSGLVFLFLIFGPTRRLIQGRNRFRGSNLRINRVGVESRIPAPWNRILNVLYLPNEKAWQITSTAGYQVSADTTDPFAAPNTVILGHSQGKNISVARRTERYQLRRVVGSSESSMMLNFRILDSPYRRGRIFIVWLFCIALFGMFIYSALHPEIWCRII